MKKIFITLLFNLLLSSTLIASHQPTNKITSLIEEITSGDIQGDPANDLLQKFQAKQDTFNKLTQTIEEAEGYMGLQTTKFGNMIGDLKSGMK